MAEEQREWLLRYSFTEEGYAAAKEAIRRIEGSKEISLSPYLRYDDDSHSITFFESHSFFRTVLSEEVWGQNFETTPLETNYDGLKAEAQRTQRTIELHSQPSSEASYPPPIINSMQDVVTHLAQQNERVFLMGEHHASFSPRAIIGELLKTLPSNSTFILEGLPNCLQDQIDHFLLTGVWDKLLETFLENLQGFYPSTQEKYGFKELLEIARDNNVRVLAPETPFSRAAMKILPPSLPQDEKNKMRFLLVNGPIIELASSQNGFCVILAGMDHIIDLGQTAGLGNIFGIRRPIKIQDQEYAAGATLLTRGENGEWIALFDTQNLARSIQSGLGLASSLKR